MLTMLLTTVAACRSETSDRNPDRTGASASGGAAASSIAASGADSSAGGMAGMPAMAGTTGMHQDTLIPRVEAHLKHLDTTNPDSLSALVPVDREVVTALIADCEQMMRQMKMDPPRKWRSAVKDLRQDLEHMGRMTGAQLRAAMPEHRKRIEGMLAMRRDMMRM
jgi:hypothetical protein